MKKKNINLLLIIIAVFLFVLWTSYSYWQFKKETKDYGKWQEIEIAEYESVDNYVIQGRLVINEEMGLTFTIPEGWEVERKDLDDFAQELNLISPDREESPDGYFIPKKGCIIGAFIRKYLQAEQEITRPFVIGKIITSQEIDTEMQRVVFVSKISSLETTLYRDKDIGVSIATEVPLENKIYQFSLLASQTEEERCRKEFDDFLQTISIK